MLSRLLHVRHPTAKQAVITAIDLLGLWSLMFSSQNTLFSFMSLLVLKLQWENHFVYSLS